MKRKLEQLKNQLMEHNRIVMTVILVLCVIITIIVAVSANKKDINENTVEVTAESAESADVEVPQLAMEQDANPTLNQLFEQYFTARSDGDMETLIALNPAIGTSDTSRLFFEKMSSYIDSYNQIEVYTKPGPAENSYVAYVKYYLKLKDWEELVPGMESYYVHMVEDGSYTIVDRGESDAAVEDYIDQITHQDDVIELNNKVAAEYNELLASNDELKQALSEMYSVVSGQVGTELADLNSETEEATVSGDEASTGDNPEDNTAETPVETVVQRVKATTTVNIRSSDSENADKIGKAQSGEEFDVIESKANGWIGISFEGGEGFIKGEYLEVVAETPVATDDGTAAASDTSEDAENVTTNGYVTAKTTVNIRTAESETAEKAGVVYQGEKLELVTKQADGWCKIKYNGKIAYVKSEFVE